MRKPKLYDFNNEKLTVEEIARRLGTSTRAIYLRLWRKTTLNAAAVIRDSRKEKTNFIEFRGEKIYLRDFCKKYHVSENSYFKARKNGNIDYFLAQLEKRLELESAGKTDEARKITFTPGVVYGSGGNQGRPKGSGKGSGIKPAILKIKPPKAPEEKKYKYNPITQTAERDITQIIPGYDPDYEPIRHVLEVYRINKKTADYVIQKKRKYYHIKKVQVRQAAFNYILRTEIPAFVLDCQHDHKSADKLLHKVNTEPKNMTLAEMKAAHPLVKDERFFNEAYFPRLTLPATYEPEDFDTED